MTTPGPRGRAVRGSLDSFHDFHLGISGDFRDVEYDAEAWDSGAVAVPAADFDASQALLREAVRLLERHASELEADGCSDACTVETCTRAATRAWLARPEVKEVGGG